MLTGKTRYRTNWRKKLILQVEHQYHRMDDLNGSGHYDEYDVKVWKDATFADLQELNLI